MKHSTYPSFLKFCVAAVISGPLLAFASASQPEADMTDRLIVKYKDSHASGKGAARVAAIGKARMAIAQRAGQQFGLSMTELRSIATGAHIMQLNKKMTVAQVAALANELASRDSSVEYAEPDRLMHKMFTPNDPRYAEQWHYFETTGGLRANLAWDKAIGTGVRVAVIDTGYRPHADMSGQYIGGYDFIGDTFMANDGGGRDTDAQDPGDAVAAGECGGGQPTSSQSSSWHGTHVAGTIAAATNNGVGVAGVAYGAKVVPVRVLGKCGGYTSDIADAIIWSAGGAVSGVPTNAYPARVLNMSLGGGGSCGSTTQNAINSARSRGAVVVVAAGNSNTDASNSNPANCAGVITVAATDRQGGRAFYSNYGSVVDVAAPGGETTTTSNGVLSILNSGTTAPASDSYAFYQGTSMAAPHVAGVAALMLSKNSALTVDEVESKLKSSSRAFPASCSGCGAGIVDASAAVDAASGTVAPTFNETESNNTTSSANLVSVSGTVVNGNMSSSTDTDYFKMSLAAGATLTSTLTPGSTSDYDLYVYNSNGTLIGKSENGTGSVDTVSVTNTGTSTFTRYVQVKYYSGGTGSTNGKYTLKMSW